MKQRVVSAIIALVIVVPIILIGGNAYMLGVGLLSILAYKELVNLRAFNNAPGIIKVLGVLSMLSVVYSSYFSIYAGNVLVYLLIAMMLVVVPSIFSKEEYNTNNSFYLMGLIIFVGLGFSGLLVVNNNLNLLLYLVCIPVFSDIFAMLTGMLIGKHKLIPDVSPKKTIEGSFGGLIMGISVPLILYHNLISELDVTVVLITIALAVFSQLGDLIFSKIKRDNDVKDYSNIMPGHGGVLDRLDSMLVVFLVYMVLSVFL